MPGLTLSEGDYLPSVVKTITQRQLVQYAEAVGDRNPLHLDAEFAASTQFGGVIAHGMLTLAFISEMMAAVFGRAWLANGCLQVRFKGAAYVGDQLEAWGLVTREEVLSEGRRFVCSVGVRHCPGGEDIITGTATLILT
jgi:3-hydroxybutyryl-CoA dehydratase